MEESAKMESVPVGSDSLAATVNTKRREKNKV